MKILTLSDRTPTYSIKQMVAEHNPDMILTLGDFHSLALEELAQINHIPNSEFMATIAIEGILKI